MCVFQQEDQQRQKYVILRNIRIRRQYKETVGNNVSSWKYIIKILNVHALSTHHFYLRNLSQGQHQANVQTHVQTYLAHLCLKKKKSLKTL